MVRKSAAFLVMLGLTFGAARAANSPATDWKYANPFCQAIAHVAPADDGSGYGLALFAGSGERIDAHVTLVSDTDAYDAHVSALLAGPADDRRSGAVFVTLPVSTGLKYYFVDSYTLDGGDAVTCPSYVFPVRDSMRNAPAGVATVAAQHLQALPPLKCGRAYIPPKLHGVLQSPVGAYGSRPLTVVARAYIDSNGYSLKEEIVQSSGVDGMDKYLLGAVGVHQFAPAQFLCVPVVGVTEVELKYFP
jgi:hypothetical protein